MKPVYLDQMIDNASKKAGNDTELAKKLEVAKTVISDWRHDRKKCSPEDQFLMVGLTGVNPVYAGVRAMVHKHAGTSKGARLKEMLERYSNHGETPYPQHIEPG